MIIWLASYPRSGNSLGRIVLRHAFGIGTYSIYNAGPPTPALRKLVGHLDTVPFEEMVQSPEWRIVKTHEMADDEFPAVHIVRDGRDALVSYAWFILSSETSGPTAPESEAFLTTLQNLVVTDGFFGGWSNHVSHWLKRPNTVTVRFEDLVQDPVGGIAEAFRRAGFLSLRQMRGARLPEFRDLHEQRPDFFRKGRIGSWREEMPQDLHVRFWERHGQMMRQLGYSRDGLS